MKKQLKMIPNLGPSVAARVLALGLLSSNLAFSQDPTAIAARKPNILFVVDTSGSMEYVTGSDTYPRCYPAEGDPARHDRSRWIDVLEVLTGTIENYACAAEDRSSSNFIEEFSMFGGTDPPDANYRNPYHRPLSNGCAITAERSAAASPSNAFDWAPPVQTPYPVNPTPPLAACATPFSQVSDGFIDANNDLARFGLMTFDPLPDEQTGYGPAPTYTPQYEGGVEGTWSYFVGSAASGKPVDCDDAVNQILEVGVRNAAAPATEGKMIYFGDQDLSNTMDTARHDRIQQVLLGTRPYGGTPINGALADARAFFLNDTDLEPLCNAAAAGTTLYGTAQSGLRLSPRFDQYVECGCREQHIILITDGEPNLDLRPHCEPTGSPDGVCPFPMTAAQILAELSSVETAGACNDASPGGTRHKIETHVVGYAISTYESGARQCTDLRTDVSDWLTPGGPCDTTLDEDMKVCCTLHRLANAGNVTDNDDPDGDGIADPAAGMPHIAPDAATLRSALSQIMAEITGTSASATRPVRSPGIGLADNTMKAFRLLTSYDPSWGVDGLWHGNIERLRWTCDSGVPEEEPKLVSAGDDFHRNVAENLSTRRFVTFIPDLTGAGGDETLRPYLGGIVDGAGLRGGTQYSGDVATMKTNIIPEALELNFAIDAGCVSTGAADNNSCRNQIIDWTFGYNDGVGNNRCPTPTDERNCSVIGDILHSTPTIVDRPTAVVDDESYETFATINRERMMMAYVSSNDGQLHAFGTSPNGPPPDAPVSTLGNNERYAFIPPAVLPRLKSQYPGAGVGTRMQLLDGVAIVQDVVSTGATPATRRFERSLNSLQNNASSWRTVLVQAFGGQQPGYFALDITDDTDPVFLWQLTTNSAGTPIFGTGGQPLIATVNLGGIETAVAVLPGGSGGSPLGGSCARSNPAAGSTWAGTHFDPGITGGAFEPRAEVNCYAPGDGAARSLTIVRLDSGLILRRFIRDPSDPSDALLLTGVFGQSPTPGNPFLDSPITGTPAAYPAGAGLIADRVFVGDQDGALWRVDVSKQDPEEWTMQLFFDAFASDGATDGKPIVVPPVLSVDQRGQITVNFATGDQDLSGSPGENHYVYSLTEVEDASGTDFAAQVNWGTRFADGEHVVGPLSLLDGALYFTTVAPALQNACNSAPANIWGVDYLQRAAPTADPFSGGVARLQPSSEPDPEQSFLVAELVDPAGTTQTNVGQVFGVSLEYVPSCTATGTATDQYTGGSRSTMGASPPPALQLVFQTSGATTQGGLGFNTSFQAVNLVQTPTASTIHSWAAVLD